MQSGLDDLPEPAELHARLIETRRLDWGEPIPTKAKIAAAYGVNATARSLTLRTRAAQVEREITDDVVASIGAGASVYQLDSRLKSPQSLARKLRTQAGTRFAKQPIEDVVRYTIVVPDPDDLVPGAIAAHGALKKRGWRINGVVNSYAEGSRTRDCTCFCRSSVSESRYRSTRRSRSRSRIRPGRCTSSSATRSSRATSVPRRATRPSPCRPRCGSPPELRT